MLEQHLYASEKIREIDAELVPISKTARVGTVRPAFASLARPIGRALHRIGHRLESWATPPLEDVPELS